MRSREGWSTHLYTRSKSKAFSFLWNRPENSLQRVSSAEADRKMGPPYLSWLIIKNINVQILHVTYSGICARWTQKWYTRSKSKDFCFLWNRSDSLQRVSSADADRKMGPPYLSWLITKNINVQILHVIYSGICARWTQKWDGCHSKRVSTSTDALPANSTITGSFYAETVLPKVVQQISSECSLTTTTTQKVLLPATMPVPRNKGRNAVPQRTQIPTSRTKYPPRPTHGAVLTLHVYATSLSSLEKQTG